MSVNEQALVETKPVVIDYSPSPVISLEKAVENLRILDRIRREIMRAGVDYDVIPGTTKPVLLKPGAERLLQFFGLGHRVECVDKVEDWSAGFFYYRFRVTIVKTYPDYEITVASCEGSANSKESRYRDRWVTESKLKELGISAIGLETRQKTGKYGTYTEYKIENPDPFSLVNTIQKMAIKRALVGATLQATATSGFFTQDLEDLDGVPINEHSAGVNTGNGNANGNGNGNRAKKANVPPGKSEVLTAMKEMGWTWDQLAEYASEVLGRKITKVLKDIRDDEWTQIHKALIAAQEGLDANEPPINIPDEDLPF